MKSICIKPHVKSNRPGALAAVAASVLLTLPGAAAATVLTEDFESFTEVATTFEDATDADPGAAEFTVTDDAPADGAGDAETGVQVVAWVAHSGAKALLVRSGSEAVVNSPQARSGPKATLDFWLWAAKGSGDPGLP